MSDLKFTSVFAPYINEYLQHKRNMGIKEITLIKLEGKLKGFDVFFNHMGIKEPVITEETISSWRKSENSNKPITTYGKTLIMRDFCRFLCKMGCVSYIPRPNRTFRTDFVPYVFTHQEMKKIFVVADSLRKHASANTRLFSFPTILRLLYSTGIRISEALNIRNKDVDWSKRTIRLTHTKNSHVRLVPLCDSMFCVLDVYCQKRNKLPIEGTDSPDAFLFITGIGKKCQPDSILTYFHKVIRKSGIIYKGGQFGPRIHDLRHTFAVHSLKKMSDSGMNLYTALPILSTMLGHSYVASTEYYIRMTLEAFPEIIQKEKQLSEIFKSINDGKQ